MDTLIFLTGIAAMIAVTSLIAYALGWLFTEVVVLPMNFKPFNCTQCLTFWFTVALNFGLSWLVAPCLMERGFVLDLLTIRYGFAGIGVLAGYINFQYIKLKYRIYD